MKMHAVQRPKYISVFSIRSDLDTMVATIATSPHAKSTLKSATFHLRTVIGMNQNAN